VSVGTGAVGAAVSGAAADAAAALAPSFTIGTTISEATAVASAASSLKTLADGPGRVNVPPPAGSSQVDQTAVAADQAQKQRQMAAGGLQGTTGTPGGQQGAVLNPATMSRSTLLGS
jgi:hypothetical protein